MLAKKNFFEVLIACDILLLGLAVLIAANLPSIENENCFESLKEPLFVRGWTEDGLRLADGRLLHLPGFHKLPTDSVALREGTCRGVEVTSEGRVIGLVTIKHWCGLDPIRKHVARVDLADLLMYLGEGETTEPLGEINRTKAKRSHAPMTQWDFDPRDYSELCLLSFAAESR